ncbi:MAG: hypothetical protein HRT37_11790 [Alteromonadaceae bacterium]|nr:hypothetical protein [Alteromonadaceae bacterium]
MLKFTKSNAMSLLVLLSLSAFANAGQDEKTGSGKKLSTNLVELYKVKSHATQHISGLEAKLSTTDESDQEELLVELAQSLLYYNDRHNKTPDTKAVTLMKANSLNTNGTNEKTSKTVNTKGPYSANSIHRKALNTYKKASQLAIKRNQIKYTRELSELTVSLQKKEKLIQIFDGLLQHGGDESGTYLAHIDYADGLAKFRDNSAETQFLSAINMRTPVDGVEANYRYANYLLNNNKPREALNVLDKFTFEERRMYVHIAMLRQKIMHKLKLNTREVDAEIKQIRKNLSANSLIGAIMKFSGIVKNQPINTLEIPKASAFAFSHNNERDDSRGKYGNSLVQLHGSYFISTHLFNTAEVLYNSARGNNLVVRSAVGWAIRNRATIDMNGCTPYNGSEGHPDVLTCRRASLSNSQNPDSTYAELDSRYACVIHGGTTKVGESHVEMDDSHVDPENIWASGVIWEMLYVFNGWLPDLTGPRTFLAGATYPEFNHYTGNPEGAQEWRRGSYCPENYTCKVRLGNVGGNDIDPGFEQESLCSEKGGNSIVDYNIDNFFWGRQNKHTTINIKPSL